MAIAKFTQVVSFFKTTLSQRLSDTASDVTLDDVPGGIVEYPTWAVIEPQGANKELIYLPTAPTSLTYSSVVRGLDPESNNDTLAATFNKEHPANVEVIIAPTHRHWNELVKVMDGTVGTGANILRVGDETDVDVTIYAQNADAAKPYVQYDSATNKWLISNDGTSTYDISAGGSGLTRGPGVDISASAITLDVRASGGLRNNQGTGTAQADVDPAIVARLDTANTWAAVQSATADNMQITTDPDTANDAVRKSYFDTTIQSQAALVRFGDSSDGAFAETSGATTWDTASKTVYQFSSFSLTGTASVALGTNLQNKRVFVLVNGDLTVTSSTVPAIDGRYRGASGATGAISLSAQSAAAGTGIQKIASSGGLGGSASTDPATFSGPGGGGGASCVTAGSVGGNGAGGTGMVAGAAGGTGLLAGAASTSPLTINHWLSILSCGDGGGAGCGSTSGSRAGGSGGAGGGCIIFIVKGAINITSTFNVAGETGGTGLANGTNYYSGGGGGGGGGSIAIFYTGALTANTATLTVSGGSGGATLYGGAGGGGGGGGAGIAIVKALQTSIMNSLAN